MIKLLIFKKRTEKGSTNTNFSSIFCELVISNQLSVDLILDWGFVPFFLIWKIFFLHLKTVTKHFMPIIVDEESKTGHRKCVKITFSGFNLKKVDKKFNKTN